MCTQDSRRPSIKVLDGPWSVLKDEDTTSTQHGTSSQAQANKTLNSTFEAEPEETARSKHPEKQETEAAAAAANGAGIPSWRAYEVLAPMLLMVIAIALVSSYLGTWRSTPLKAILRQTGRVRFPDHHAGHHGYFRFDPVGRMVREFLPISLWCDISYFQQVVLRL